VLREEGRGYDRRGVGLIETFERQWLHFLVSVMPMAGKHSACCAAASCSRAMQKTKHLLRLTGVYMMMALPRALLQESMVV